MLALASCSGGAGETGPPPSFVIVLADDLGRADVYQGSRFRRTPRIDALADAGLVFSDAYVPSPVCSPSRAALVTGLSPARLHITAALGPRIPARPRTSPAMRPSALRRYGTSCSSGVDSVDADRPTRP